MPSPLLISHLFFQICIICAGFIILFLLYRCYLRQSHTNRPHQSSQKRSSQQGSAATTALKLIALEHECLHVAYDGGHFAGNEWDEGSYPYVLYGSYVDNSIYKSL